MTTEWLASVPAPGFVVDAGPLLIHAFSVFEDGRYLPKVSGNIPLRDLPSVSKGLDSIFASHYPLATTPQVLIEFQRRAQANVGLDATGLRGLLQQYLPVLAGLREEYVPKEELLRLKFSWNAWWLCFADVSVLYASQRRGALLLTLDSPLRQFCDHVGVKARHIYYEIY